MDGVSNGEGGRRWKMGFSRGSWQYGLAVSDMDPKYTPHSPRSHVGAAALASIEVSKG